MGPDLSPVRLTQPERTTSGMKRGLPRRYRCHRCGGGGGGDGGVAVVVVVVAAVVVVVVVVVVVAAAAAAAVVAAVGVGDAVAAGHR